MVYELVRKKINLSELKEFEGLDSYLKDAYVKYIVTLAMPAVMEKVNALGKAMDLEKHIKENDAAIQAAVVDALRNLPV